MTEEGDLNAQMENLEIGDLLILHFNGKRFCFPVVSVISEGDRRQYAFASPDTCSVHNICILPHSFAWSKERQTFVAACCGADEIPPGGTFSVVKEDYAMDIALVVQSRLSTNSAVH